MFLNRLLSVYCAWREQQQQLCKWVSPSQKYLFIFPSWLPFAIVDSRDSYQLGTTSKEKLLTKDNSELDWLKTPLFISTPPLSYIFDGFWQFWTFLGNKIYIIDSRVFFVPYPSASVVKKIFAVYGIFLAILTIFGIFLMILTISDILINWAWLQKKNFSRKTTQNLIGSKLVYSTPLLHTKKWRGPRRPVSTDPFRLHF